MTEDEIEQKESREQIKELNDSDLDWQMACTLHSLSHPDFRRASRERIAARENLDEIESDESSLKTLNSLAAMLGEEYARRGRRMTLDEIGYDKVAEQLMNFGG